MKYAVQMGSGAMIHTKFHKDRLCHSKVNRGVTYRHTQAAWRSHKPTLFLKIKKAG
jgi:hypothetical protein